MIEPDMEVEGCFNKVQDADLINRHNSGTRNTAHKAELPCTYAANYLHFLVLGFHNPSNMLTHHIMLVSDSNAMQRLKAHDTGSCAHPNERIATFSTRAYSTSVIDGNYCPGSSRRDMCTVTTSQVAALHVVRFWRLAYRQEKMFCIL